VPTDRPPIASRFSDWAENPSSIAVQAAVTVSSWVWTGLFGAGLVLFLGRAPHVRDFFGLETWWALGVLGVLVAYSIIGVLLTRRASPNVRAVAAIVGNALTMWFVASLVALCRERGAMALAFLPVFVAAYHGYLFRFSVRWPYMAACTLAGIAGALALSAHHLTLFALITPLALAIGLTLGTVALRTDALQAEREQLRAAISAQTLEEKSRETQRLSTALLDVLGQNHDIANSLAAARVNADWLHRQTAEGAAAPEASDLHTMSAELRESLERLARILAESRRIGQEMGPAAALHEVNVTSCVMHTSKIVEVKFRRPIDLALDIPTNLHALMRGGATNLERVLENLLTNAFEGNGERGATLVAVRANDRPIGFVTVEVEDDGPGFVDKTLRQSIHAFGTTKRDGGGLGLYTAERLVVASGGELIRANRPEGGAIVRVTLPKGGMP